MWDWDLIIGNLCNIFTNPLFGILENISWELWIYIENKMWIDNFIPIKNKKNFCKFFINKGINIFSK